MAGRRKRVMVAGHPKAHKRGKCPRCGRKHDRSAHWSHKANTGEKSYKVSRAKKFPAKTAKVGGAIRGARRAGGPARGASTHKRGKSTSGKVAVPRKKR